MSNFAIVSDLDFVLDVRVIEQDVIDTGLFGNPSSFVQTSYNTRGGIHFDPSTGNPSLDQTKALRKNYAGIGYKFDRIRNAFIPPKEFPSWVLNESTCLWESPVAKPIDGKLYNWDESSISWVAVAGPGETPVVSVP